MKLETISKWFNVMIPTVNPTCLVNLLLFPKSLVFKNADTISVLKIFIEMQLGEMPHSLVSQS